MNGRDNLGRALDERLARQRVAVDDAAEARGGAQHARREDLFAR